MNEFKEEVKGMRKERRNYLKSIQKDPLELKVTTNKIRKKIMDEIEKYGKEENLLEQNRSELDEDKSPTRLLTKQRK